MKSSNQTNLNLQLFAVNAISVLVFYIGLSICYWHLSHHYGYMFFHFDPNLTKILVSLFVLLILVLLMEHALTVNNFFFFLYIFSFMIPGLVWFSAGTGSIFQVLILIGILGVLKIPRFVRIRRPTFRTVGDYPLIIAAVCAAGVIVLWALAANGGALNFSIFDVYLYRREAAGNLPGVFGYFFPQVAKAVVPLAIALALHHRWWGSLTLICALSFLMFATLHHKSVLFAPLLLIAIYYVQGSKNGLRPIIIAFGVFGGLVASEALLYEFLNISDRAGFINVLFVRRVFFVPVILDSLYIEFFDSNPFYYWASSRVTFGLVDTDYGLVATKLMGLVFFGREGMSANSGLVASGYSNAGLIGIFIYAVLLMACMMLLNAHGRRIGHKIVITASVPLVHTMITGSDMLTSLLTGGMGTLFFLLLFLKERV